MASNSSSQHPPFDETFQKGIASPVKEGHSPQPLPLVISTQYFYSYPRVFPVVLHPTGTGQLQQMKLVYIICKNSAQYIQKKEPNTR